MYSLLSWIWGAIKGIGKRLLALCGMLWELASHVWAWIVGGVLYLVSQVGAWITDAISAAIDKLGRLPLLAQDGTWFDVHADGVALAKYVLLHWVQLPVAVELLVGFMAAWIACKVARLAMIPIRAVLDLL